MPWIKSMPRLSHKSQKPQVSYSLTRSTAQNLADATKPP